MELTDSEAADFSDFLRDDGCSPPQFTIQVTDRGSCKVEQPAACDDALLQRMMLVSHELTKRNRPVIKCVVKGKVVQSVSAIRDGSMIATLARIDSRAFEECVAGMRTGHNISPLPTCTGSLVTDSEARRQSKLVGTKWQRCGSRPPSGTEIHDEKLAAMLRKSADLTLKVSEWYAINGPSLTEDCFILAGSQYYRPTSQSDDLCSAMSRFSATLAPPTAPSFMHVSGDLSESVLVRPGTVLTFEIECRGLTRSIHVPAKGVYDGFAEKCDMRLKFMKDMMATLASSTDADVRMRSTFLSAHKIYVRSLPEDVQMLTLYVVREARRAGRSNKKQDLPRLLAVAVDCELAAIPAGQEWAEAVECAVCFEPLSGHAEWACACCRNRLHSDCADVWRRKGATCPMCRTAM